MTYARKRFVLIAATALWAAATPAWAAPGEHHGAPARHPTTARPDSLRTKLDARIRTVEAKLANARKAGHLSAADTAKLRKRIDWVKTGSATLSRKQGFLSAAESASYNRTLDEVEHELHG
jgi:hypothetical protein